MSRLRINLDVRWRGEPLGDLASRWAWTAWWIAKFVGLAVVYVPYWYVRDAVRRRWIGEDS